MGYRNSIWIIEKEKADSFRGKTYEELKEKDYNYVDDYRLLEENGGTLAIDLGKYVDHKPVKPFISPFFLDKKVHESTNNESECVLLDPKGLQALATHYKQAVIENNKQILDLYLNEPTIGGERLYSLLQSHTNNIQDIDEPVESKWTLCDVWLWEYEVLNLMYLLKVFDPDKYYLVWRGG